MGDKRVRFSEWPPRDSSGALEPRRHNTITLFRALPWTVKMFETVVPEQYWHPYVDPEIEATIAVIKCACGLTLWAGGTQASECECGRWFLFLGDELRSFRPPDEADDPAES